MSRKGRVLLDSSSYVNFIEGSTLFSQSVMCRNFGKELAILFYRSAAAPWGHMASIIKKSLTGESFSFGFTPTTVSIRSFS